MEKLRSAPFVRLLVPLITGIILAEWATSEKHWFYLTIPVVFTLSLFYFKKCSYRNETQLGLLLLLIFLSLGFALDVSQRYEPESLSGNHYYAVLDEFPIEKDKTFKAVIRLVAPKIKVFAYFEKSDEIANAKPGSLFFFKDNPVLITNPGNPFEFDYKTYSIRNGIGHRVYLKRDCYHFLPPYKILNLQDRALILRERLLKSLSQNGVKGETFHVISSITFGARDNLDPETLQSFIKTGTIHVLAVSGGNVAVIFIMINYLLFFLKKYKAGIIFYTVLMISGIWGYALITGLSPSVLRAATMFTFIVVGNNLRRNPNIYNSLAASAFVLMCINPSLLFDVGFQLSYAAVFAIVMLHPLFYKSICFRYWILDRLWLLFTVSLSAQIGTLPFSLYYFHQFPCYFWLSNMVVVPLVTVLLYLTLLAIAILPYFSFLGVMAAHFLNWIGDRMLEFLQLIEGLPYAVLENLYPSVSELILTTSFLLFAWLFVIYKKGKFALMALASFAIMLFIDNIEKYNSISRKEIVVFNIPGKILLAFTNGEQTTWLTGEEPKTFRKLDYFTKPYKGFRGINKDAVICLSDTSCKLNCLTMKKNFINFLGLNMCLLNNEGSKHPSFKGFPPTDIILLTDNLTMKHSEFRKIFPRTAIINTRPTFAFYGKNPISENIISKVVNSGLDKGKAIIITMNSLPSNNKDKFRMRYIEN